MKFQIQMKDPDGFYDSVRRAAEDSAASVKNISKDEREALEDSRRNELTESAERWFQYSEYVTIEIDTEAKTATVVPVR